MEYEEVIENSLKKMLIPRKQKEMSSIKEKVKQEVDPIEKRRRARERKKKSDNANKNTCLYLQYLLLYLDPSTEIALNENADDAPMGF